MRGRRGTGLSRGLLVLALLSGAGSPVNAQIPAAALGGAPEPVLIELQIGRLATRTVQAYRVRTEALIPLSQLLELTEIRFHLSADGRLEARVDPGDRRLIVDARRDTMQYGTHRVRLEPDFKLFREGELYVGTERLGDLLGARFVVTWPDLVVTLVDPSDLPVGRRTRREAEREAFLQRGERSAPDVRLGVERPSWDGIVLDYTVFSPSTAPLEGAAYTASLGADALGGALQLGVRSVGPAGVGVAELDGSWTGVWRDRPWLRQVRLGDGTATGPRGRTLRGVLLTNAPYLRPSYVADVPYSGDLGPGWSVEAYRGGDLVAYDSTDAAGAFTLNLPVRYGENPVDFVAYGPFGEIRAFNRTYRVLAELLPARRLEYGVSAGSCRSPLCGATANADVRYGLARRWSVQAGVDGFWRDTVPDVVHPYISLVGNPTNAWALELEGVGRGYVRGGIRYEPTLNLRLAAEAAAFAADTLQPVVHPRGRRSQWTLTAFWRPAPREGFAFLDGRLEQVRTTLGDELHARMAASFQVADVRWFPFVRLQRTPDTAATRPFAGFDVSSLPHPALGPVLGPVWVRGGMEAGRSGVTRVAVYAARPLGAALRAEIGVTWSDGSLGPTYSLVVTTNLPVVRAQTTLTASPGAPARATQFVQGSLLWDRASGAIAAVPGPALERAGLTGYAFLDENGNGTRDPGEEAIPDLRVRVGSASARTDASGHYRVWDLIPFEPVLVTVDSLSLSSPLVVPAFATASVVPGPNRFRALDIPIARAGVIEGRVELAGRGRGGVTLRLTDRRTGTRRRLTTFSDGAFYALGIRPGDYELTVEERVLDALGAAAEPVRFTLVSGANGVGRDGIVVTLTPRP